MRSHLLMYIMYKKFQAHVNTPLPYRFSVLSTQVLMKYNYTKILHKMFFLKRFVSKQFSLYLLPLSWINIIFTLHKCEQIY